MPRFRLADAFTSSRTLGNLSQVTTAKLAASMAGMVPADANARLAASVGVTKIVKDLSKTHARILRSAMPQVRLTASMAGMVPKDFNARLAASMAGMVPADANARLAASADVTKIVKDLSETHAGILRLAMPQVRLAESMAGGMILRDFNTTHAVSMAGMVPKDFNARLAASMAGMVPKDFNTKLATSGVLRDIIEMQARLAAIARTTPSDSLSDTEFGTALSRDSARLLFGNYVYCLVLSLVLLAYIRVIGESETDSQIFSIFIFATGLGAHQIAKLAREAAFRTYDFLYPLE